MSESPIELRGKSGGVVFQGTQSPGGGSQPSAIITAGSTADFFENPTAVACAADGRFYVSEDVPQINVMSPDGGAAIAAWDGNAWTTPMTTVTGLAISPDSASIYIADQASRIARAVAADGTELGEFDGAASGAPFNSPLGVAVQSNGRVLVSCFGDNRLVRCTALGAFVDLLDASASGAPLNGPGAIAVAPGLDTIYVCDVFNDRVVIFAADGTYDATFDCADSGIPFSAAASTLSGIAVTAAGDVLVASGSGRITRHAANGAFVDGTAGFPVGASSHQWGSTSLAARPNGTPYVYVVNAEASIQVMRLLVVGTP